jgi:hypothetical protein
MSERCPTPHSPPLHAASTLALCLILGVAGCKHTAAPAPESDAALTQAVQTKLAADTSLASEPIQASVQQGVATLSGPVSSDAARSLAANDAAQVSGIRTVVNNLTVQPAAPAATAKIALPPPPPIPREKPDRHPKPPAKPLASVAAVQQAPPPPQEQAAPIERTAPPIEVTHTLPITPPAFPPAAFRTITLPADTALSVRINTALDSATAQSGDPFTGSIASDVVVDGITVLPQGTSVSGRVNTVQEAGHFKGNSLLTITLTSVGAKGGNLDVSTDEYSKAGNGRGKNTAEKVGGGAAVGAILGGILGGGKGAAIGAGVGGGAGAGVQGVTRGQQVQIPAESLVRFHLTGPLSVRVANSAKAAGSPDAELQHHDQ